MARAHINPDYCSNGWEKILVIQTKYTKIVYPCFGNVIFEPQGMRLEKQKSECK